jgi:hypothetical protein
MYPSISNGTSIVGGARTKAGAQCAIQVTLGGSADQQNAINAASWLLSIGDWHDKNVSGTMVVKGKRLQELVLGSKTETPTISITALTISDCKALTSILLSSISTLQGTLDLSSCENLRKVYADGTAISQIILPNGGGLEYVEYPASNAYLLLSNFPVLNSAGLVIADCAANITDFMVQECPNLNSLDVLYDIMEAQESQTAHTLKRVRAIGFTVAYNGTKGSKMLDYLAKLSDGTFVGLDSGGVAGSEAKPVIDGTLTMGCNVYEDSVSKLKAYFDRLVLNITGEYYIRFADSVIQALCASYYGDGTGCTKENVEAVTSIETGKFNANTTITSFDEFEKFINCTIINDATFKGCTALSSIKFPPNVSKIGAGAFNGCTALSSIDLSQITAVCELNGGCFFSSGIKELTIPGYFTFNANNFGGICGNCTALTKIIYGEGLTKYSGSNACTALKLIDLPSTMETIGGNLIHHCHNIEKIICRAATPPTFSSGYGWSNAAVKIYVPDSSVDSYKAATGWSAKASSIYPISEMV